MFFDKKEKNDEVKSIAKDKGELVVYSGTIISEGDIIKKKRKHQTIKIKTKRGVHQVIFDNDKPKELVTGWNGTLVVSEETATLSKMQKLNDKAGASKVKGKLSMVGIDGGNTISFDNSVSLNNVWIRVSVKEKYNKFQFIV
jgi:hypothetical protein